VTIARNKNVSALGLVKHFSIDDLQRQDEQSRSYQFHMTFKKTVEDQVQKRNFEIQPEQRVDG
jgi:hypothetical protein